MTNFRRTLYVAAVIGLSAPPVYYLSRTVPARVATLFNFRALEAHAQTPWQGVVLHQIEKETCDSNAKDPCKETGRVTIAIGADYERAQVDEPSPAHAATVDPARHISGRGRVATIYPSIGMYTSYDSPAWRPAETRGATLNPLTDCSTAMDGAPAVGNPQRQGEETILGYRTIKYVRDTPSAVSTQWRAPALACEPLRVRMEWKSQKEKNYQTLFRETVRVEIGRPDESYFELPAGMRHAPPSEVKLALNKARGERNGQSPEQLEKSAAIVREGMKAQDEKWKARLSAEERARLKL